MSGKAVPALESDPLDAELARRLNAWQESDGADADCTQDTTGVMVECAVWFAVGLLLWAFAALQVVAL